MVSGLDLDVTDSLYVLPSSTSQLNMVTSLLSKSRSVMERGRCL